VFRLAFLLAGALALAGALLALRIQRAPKLAPVTA
jgi:hypothetical protein